MKKLIPILLVLTGSCHKDPVITYNNINMADYPIAVNNKWTYQVSDSINNTVDTAVFKINAEMAINNDTLFFTTQTLMHGAVVDSGTIMKTATSYIYSPNGYGLFDRLKLTFPMHLNSAWGGPIVNGDTLTVSQVITSLNVLGVNYLNVLDIKRSLIIPDYYVSQQVEMAPHIGIVQQNFEIQPWIPLKRSIRLISYELH